MIALEPTQQLRDAIAEHIGVNETEPGVYVVDVPWSFPDGDQCRVFVSKSQNGKWNVTDGGSSIMRASYANEVDVLEKGYIERFRQIVSLYGLREDEGELLVDESQDVGGAVFTVAQASIDVVHLSRLPKDRSHSPKSRFIEKLSSLIESTVSAEHLKRDWTDTVNDKKQLYPVTYRIDPSRGDPIFLWAVRSPNSCRRAIMSCLFHKLHTGEFLATAVYAKESALPTQDVARLNQQVERSFPSLRDADAIQKYLALKI